LNLVPIAVCLEVDEATTLRLIGQTYLANAEAFPNLTCEYTLSMGYARDDREALARGPVRHVVQARALWVRGRGVERYEVTRDLRRAPPSVSVIGGKGTMSVLLPPQTVLRDESFCLSISGVMAGGVIGATRRIGAMPTYTPWNYANETGSEGHYTLGNLIADHLGSSNHVITLVRGDPLHPDLARVGVTPHDRAAASSVFFVDEAKACLPREVWLLVEGRVGRKIYVPDVKACSGGRWFPTRIVVSTPNDNTREGVFIKELRVTSLDVDRTPTSEQLTVALPAGTRLTAREYTGAQFQLKAARRVAVSDIPGLVATARDVADAAEKGVVPASVAPEAGSWRPWIIAANALLVLAVVGYLVWRRNR
jgi:hypothetical protein